MKKQSIYLEVESRSNFPSIENKILAYWKEHNIFQPSIDNKPAINSIECATNNEFIFYDHPPFANGLPHYGHLLTGFIKDVYVRYQTTKGKKLSADLDGIAMGCLQKWA